MAVVTPGALYVSSVHGVLEPAKDLSHDLGVFWVICDSVRTDPHTVIHEERCRPMALRCPVLPPLYMTAACQVRVVFCSLCMTRTSKLSSLMSQASCERSARTLRAQRTGAVGVR